MNMKIVGGLLAVLFVAQAVQVGAVSKLSNAVARNNNAVSQQSVAINQMAYQNQSAAVGATYLPPPDPEEPGVINIYYFYWADGSCDVVMADSVTGDAILYVEDGCASLPLISNYNSMEQLSFSGDDSSIGRMQLRLWFAGYIKDKTQITGKMSSMTTSAIRDFQKGNNLPQTGVYGTQTKALLNKVLSPLKASAILPLKSI